MKKVAFITSILGSYESTCKPFVQQTIDCDFICFTDNPDIETNGWEIDLNSYFDTHKSPIDNGLYVNSVHKQGRLAELNNRHTFNLAKYYKQQWKLIPRLKDYDVVIWMDGTLEILSSNVAEYMLEMCPKYDIVTWHHEMRGGFLFHEAFSSFLPKYHDVNYRNQRQPYQDVMRQYYAYLRDGYDEDYFKKFERKEGRGRGDHFGVWATGFVAFNNRNEKINDFLDRWYLQTLKYTTQDQVGFPKVVQETHIVPYTLPDQVFGGDESHTQNDMFKVHLHGK
jgi:hypothetical protein